MHPGERGRGGYDRGGGRGRGGRGQGHRGQSRGGYRPQNEHSYDENYGGPVQDSYRDRTDYPARGGREMSRGGDGQLSRGGYHNFNPDQRQGPRGPPISPHDMGGGLLGPGPFDQNIRPPPSFGPNFRGPPHPQQMPMNFPPDQMPPHMQDYDEVEITYRVKPRQNLPQQMPYQQQQYHHPQMNVPPPPMPGNQQQQYHQPPPLLGNIGPQNNNQRPGSMMDIRNPAQENMYGSREQLSRGGSCQNLPRSSSMQNVGGTRGRGGPSQNQRIPNRGRGRGGHPQRERRTSHDTHDQMHSNDLNRGQKEQIERQDTTSEMGNDTELRHNIDRGRGRGRGRRGRGRREYNREANTAPLDDEIERYDKENENSQSNNTRERGRGRRRRNRPGRGAADSQVSEEDNSRRDVEKLGENSENNGISNMRNRRMGRGRGRGGHFYPRGSFRGKFGNKVLNRPGMAFAQRHRNDSESSDVSVVSTLTETTETESVPDTTGDPVRAGVQGIESVSIQTLKNRLYRYKRKLTGFKKKENPDLDEIQKLQEEIAEIDTVIQRRIKEEKESKSVNSNVIAASENGDVDAVKQRSPVQQRRLKVVGSSKKGMVSFRPKTKLKGAKPSKQLVGHTNINDTEEDLQNSSSEYSDVDESGDYEEKPDANPKVESCKPARNRRKNKNPAPGSKNIDVTDWQGKLKGLINAEPDVRDTQSDESKGAKPKIRNAGKNIIDGNNKATQNKHTVRDLGKSDENLMNKTTKGSQKQKPTETERDTPSASKETEPKRQNVRTRSGSSVSDSTVDTDPDEIEVFKFIVKEMNGQASMDDIKSKCSLFNEYQGEFDEWFRKHSRKFTLFKRDNKVLKVGVYVKDAEYCLDYITRRGCSKNGCGRYHVCKNLLCGLCSFGEKCKFSHNTMDEHNETISRDLGFVNAFNNEQIINILSMRVPHVCECWNTEGSCTDIACCKLHICQRHMFGDCLEGDGCPFEHSLTTKQNLMVTNAYHMAKKIPKNFNKLIFVLKRPPAHVISKEKDRETTDASSEGTGLGGTTDKVGIEETSSATHPGSQQAQKKLHTRPGRKARQSESEDDAYLKSDTADTKPRYICENQLTGRCDIKRCSNFHGDTSELPYIWQVKLYGSWLSVPEGQMLKVEEDFCNLKESSGPNIIATEDGMYQEYNVHFYPEVYATATHLDIGGEKIRTQARRHSTSSYAEGEWADNSFKTQWRWSFEDNFGKFHPFDSDKLQYTLEKKFLSGQKKYLYSRENYRFKYCLDFTDMEQYNLDTWKRRKIYRRPLLVTKVDVAQRRFPPCLQRPISLSVSLPKGWATWDLAHPFELVELDVTHKSYLAADDSFFKTLDRNVLVIDRVYRVQNPHLWKDYVSHKDTMAEKAERAGLSRDVKELLLFHGTDSLDTVRGIAINNFDFRLSGKNATMYGEGAYFAKNAKYSHAYTKPPDRFMFIARVLVGEHTQGKRDDKRPPAKPGAAHELYDSCVDNINSPSIYIVYDTKQYYPEFLIQYHTTEGSVSSRKPAVPAKPLVPAKPTLSAKPAVSPKPAVAPKPSTYDQSAMYPSSSVRYPPTTLSYPDSSVGYPTSPVSYPTTPVSYPASAVSNRTAARTRSPSPPRIANSDLGYSSSPNFSTVRRARTPSPPPIVYPRHTPSSAAARSSSPSRSSTTSAAASNQGASQRGHDTEKSCVIQ